METRYRLSAALASDLAFGMARIGETAKNDRVFVLREKRESARCVALCCEV